MKIAILSDTHYGFKKGSKHFHDYFELFYKNVFFPTIEERGIKTVIHMGDAFDNRKGIDFWGLDWTRRVVLEPLRKYEVYMLVGNHDIFFRNSTIINAIDLLLQEYDNVIPISSPKEFCIDGLDTLMLPWICTDNREKTDYLLKNTQAKVIFSHLELSGFVAYPGHIMKEGMDASIFKKFDRVYSGHYHTKSDDGKIYYLGNPYQMFWNDVDDTRGFHIFDTDTYELEYFKNPYNMFERIYYEDTDYKKFKTSYLEEKIVKVVVRQKTDQLKFDKFIDKILKANPLDLKVVEIIDVNDGDVDCEEISAEDTLSILDKYVEEAEFNLDKMIVKKLLRDVYKEALEIE
jgi:DNA repair exonuclease SbcCD nuclease subunit